MLTFSILCGICFAGKQHAHCLHACSTVYLLRSGHASISIILTIQIALANIGSDILVGQGQLAFDVNAGHITPVLLHDSHDCAEALSSGTPSSAAKAQLLLDLAATKPQDAQYAAWILPLAAAQLLNAAPCAASHLWLQVSLVMHSIRFAVRCHLFAI